MIAVIATDLAVAIMFFVMRRYLMAAPVAAPASLDTTEATGEMEDALRSVRLQAEQAATEIARQKAQLHRLLADVEHQHATQPVALSQPVLSRKEVVRLSAEGHSLRAIAARSGVSVEEAA